MAINLKFDLMGNPEPPSIVLANRNGNKLGQLNVNVDSIDVSDKFNAASEFSFTLNKYIDGKPTPLWDKVKDFKLVYCPEWDLWFEIKVELDETTETVKTVFCTQLGQAELSQIIVYNIHINEEGDPNWDTNNEAYKSTILYDEEHIDTSLLHRLLKDKAPHYSIAYVDESIQRVQKSFSFDNTSICDALNEVAEEIGCLFVYNSNSTKGGKPSRTISVYDLQQNCNDCGHRGEFTDKCPKCESKNIKYGYGEDTAIFVTSDELATEGIQLVTDVDAVKNCFKLEGGDDLMTATIRNCNPNGSDYIWYFSDALKEDMSKELVAKIESYDEKYQDYYNNHVSELNETLVNQYNALVNKYKEYYNTKSTCLNCGHEDYFQEQCPKCNSQNILNGQNLQTIPTEIAGYPDLMTVYYNTIDLLLYLESGLMPTPNIEANKTSAEEQIALLTTSSLSPVAVNVKEAEDISETTSKSAVLSMAKVLIKSTYKVEAETLAFNNVIDTDGVVVAKTWEGKFTVTNYSDDTDTATSDSISVTVNVDAKTFIEQKIKKTLNKENTDDYSITGLFAKEYDEFCEEIKKYALNPLDNFSKACDTCLSILAEQGVGDDGSNEDNETDEATKKALYDALYKPYFDKQQAINIEIKTRQNEIAIIEGVWDKADESNLKCITWGLQQYIEKCQQDIQEALDFEKHLGEDLWLEFCAYRREDKYSNSNYISDGLNNSELFERANEFIAVAEEEIFKSAELQHSISTTLNNLLSLPKFKPLLKSFKAGNWIRVQVDDKVYKLRLLEYGFGYDDSESISVEFSDVIKIKNGVTDVKEVLEQASSMASSYDSVQRQAEKGDVARSTIDQWLVDGLNAANMQIASNDSEEVLLTKNGLLARSYDDITGTYSPEQLKITHNIMAYTDDNWKTVSSALGKHNYNKWNGSSFVDDEGYGLTSKFVTAGYITGSQIIGGEILSSNYQVGESGTYLNLIKGDFDFAGGKIVYNADKNRVTLSGVEIQWDSVNKPTIENIDGLSGITEDIRIIEQGLSATTINGQYVISPNIIGGYLDIKNSTNNTGVVIDPNGLVNEDYIFRVYNGNTTTIGADINGNAEFSGTIKSSKIESTDIVGSTITGGTITAGDTLYIGSQKDEDGNIIENSYSAWIDTDGVLHTNEAHINGSITAIDGQIGGFTIEPTKTEEGVIKPGGWLYSGELQEGQDSVQIGDDKSIFLSATNMEGTMPFYNLIERTDENGDVVYDENDNAIYDITESNLFKDDWRITVGSNFGVTSDGTAYMSNCEIAGGSLRMGTEGDGYHTSISKDGVLYAQGAHIDGTITAAGDMGIQYPSLVSTGEKSPICFKAGGTDDEVLIKEETFTFTSNGSLWSQTISLDDEQKTTHLVTNAKCLTSNKVHEGSGTSSRISVTSGTISTGDGYYYASTTVELLPSWVSKEHIIELSINSPEMDVSYLGDGKVLVSVNALMPNQTYFGMINYHYWFDENLNVFVDIAENKDEVTFSLYPQTIDVEYDIDVKYILEPKDFGFKVLRDGSLYANEAYLKGTIYATDGEFKGTIYATDGEFNGTIYATDGEFTGKVNAKEGTIGKLLIQDGGLAYNTETSDVYSLNSAGLILEKSSAKIQVGDLTMGYDTSNRTTVINTTGRLTLQGANDARIEFMKDSTSTTAQSDIYIWFRQYSNSSTNINDWKGEVWLTSDSAPIYPVSLNIAWRALDEDWKGDVTIADSGTIVLTLSQGCYVSEHQTISYANRANQGIKFGIGNTWTNTTNSITDTNLGVISSFSQTQSPQNIYITGDLLPSSSTSYNLGGGDNYWNTIYFKTTAISSSDKNQKNTIQSLSEIHEQIFDSLHPVSYKFNDSTSNRTHFGLIAQSVKEAIINAGLTTQEFAAYCEWKNDDGSIGCGLRYSEFIALCIDQIQKLKKRVVELEDKLESLE